MLDNIPAISSTPCLALADILHEAPALIQLLSSASLKSLRLTSLALRQPVHSQIKVLRLPSSFQCGPDTHLLTKGGWLQLEVLDLTFISLTTGAVCQMAQQAHWPNLKHLKVAGDTLSARAIKQLSKGYWPQLASVAVTYTKEVVEPGIKHLFCDKWSMLASLQLTHVNLSATAIARLAKQPWPSLVHLDLSYTDMCNDAISYLVAGSWQHLLSLNLAGNELNAEAVSALTTAPWQELQRLNVESCELSLASVNDLMEGQWPQLRSLKLAHNCLFSSSQQMTAVRTGLKRLDLTNTGLTTVSKAVLQSWSTLEYLSISRNSLCKEFVQGFVTAQFASLKALSFQMIVRNGSYLPLLSANLPLLEELDLRCAPVVVTLSTLCQGRWPQVRRLCLANADFREPWLLGLRHLPNLEVLNLDNHGMWMRMWRRMCIPALNA